MACKHPDSVHANLRCKIQHAARSSGRRLLGFGLLSVRTDAQAREAEGVPAERILGEVMLEAATAMNEQSTVMQHAMQRLYNIAVQDTTCSVQQSC